MMLHVVQESESSIVLVFPLAVFELARVTEDFWAWRTEGGDFWLVEPIRC